MVIGFSIDIEVRLINRIRIVDMDTLLQSLLPGSPVTASRMRPGPIRRDWATVVCFSCGKADMGWVGAPN